VKSCSLAIYWVAAVGLAASATMGRAGTVSIDLVPVGDVMNIADSRTGYGAVAYPYSIGKYDVTMGQYAAFLNAVAANGDPYGLYSASMATATPTYGITQTSTSAGFVYAAKGNSANVPVTYVNWGSAARFVNWLANNEPTGPEGPGTTETGTYALNGSTGSAALMAVTRSSTATWVLPTVDEWYKAAYYKSGGTSAGYWTYPTQCDSIPSNLLSLTGTNNANFFDYINNRFTDATNRLTLVGAFALSPGPYGTFDQGGDVWQWDETAVGGVSRDQRGGSFAGTSFGLSAQGYNDPSPLVSDSTVGFRIAKVGTSVPEPSAVAILFAVALVLAIRGSISIPRTTRENAAQLTPPSPASNVKVREAVYGTELLRYGRSGG
jgi:formylglycine-generating enzyme required for sulfatase activity